MKIIKKSALAVIQNNKLLVVRSHHSQFLLMPGGKPEEGESAVAALEREIKEELNCSIDKHTIKFIGTFEDVAAGGNKSRVKIDLFSGKLKGAPKPSSEIEELVWISAAEVATNSQISPIIRNKIVPFLVGKNVLV